MAQPKRPVHARLGLPTRRYRHTSPRCTPGLFATVCVLCVVAAFPGFMAIRGVRPLPFALSSWQALVCLVVAFALVFVLFRTRKSGLVHERWHALVIRRVTGEPAVVGEYRDRAGRRYGDYANPARGVWILDRWYLAVEIAALLAPSLLVAASGVVFSLIPAGAVREAAVFTASPVLAFLLASAASDLHSGLLILGAMALGQRRYYHSRRILTMWTPA